MHNYVTGSSLRKEEGRSNPLPHTYLLNVKPPVVENSVTGRPPPPKDGGKVKRVAPRVGYRHIQQVLNGVALLCVNNH